MKEKLKAAGTKVRGFARTHKPEILSVMSIASTAAGMILTAKATVKAVRAVDRRKAEIMEENPSIESVEDIHLSKLEVFKLTWNYYIYAGAALATGTACSIGNAKEGVKRGLAAMSMSEAADLARGELELYKKNLSKVVSEEKAKQIEEEVEAEKEAKIADLCEKRLVTDPTFIIDTGRGSDLCYDYWNDRYFMTDINDLYRAVNELNDRMTKSPFVGTATLNEYYEEIGLRESGAGSELGWCISNGLIELREKYGGHARSRKSCFILDFVKNPNYTSLQYVNGRDMDREYTY